MLNIGQTIPVFAAMNAGGFDWNIDANYSAKRECWRIGLPNMDIDFIS